MPWGGKKKNRTTPAPVPSPCNVVVVLPYTDAPLSPLLPLTPFAPVEEYPDMVVTQRCIPPSLRFKQLQCSWRRPRACTRKPLILIQWHSPTRSPKLHQAANCQIRAPHCLIPSQSLTC